MQLAMVLDAEQVTVRQQECQAGRIATQPEIGNENGRRDAAFDQCRGDPLIEIAGAGIEGQGDDKPVHRWVWQPHARFDWRIQCGWGTEWCYWQNGGRHQQAATRQAQAAHIRLFPKGTISHKRQPR